MSELQEYVREFARRNAIRHYEGIAGWRGQLYPLRLVTLSGGGYRAALYHTGVLRALIESGFLGEPDPDIQVLVNAVSGASIPVMLWDQAMNLCPGVLDEDPLWPERAVLRLVETSPGVGGRLNWLVRRIHPRWSWRQFLHDWWSSLVPSLARGIQRNWAPYLLASGGLVNFSVELLDFLSGDVFVFTHGLLSRPDQSFHKDGQKDGGGEAALARPGVPDMLSAATAFPLYFSPLRRSVRRLVVDGPIELLDAGLIDNLGLLPFVPLIEARAGEGWSDPPSRWFFADAGRKMSIPLGAGGLQHLLDRRVLKLSFLDRLFRITGDLSQPQLSRVVLDVAAPCAGFSMLGIEIGTLPYGESPWHTTARFPDPDTAARLETGLFPLSREDALCILLQGAQTASAAIGMSEAARSALRDKLTYLNADRNC